VDATSTINPLGYIDACGTCVNEGIEVDGQSDPLRCCARDGGRSAGDRTHKRRPKPPQAAPVKSWGGERRGNGVAMTASGMGQEGERERTTAEVSKVLDGIKTWG